LRVLVKKHPYFHLLVDSHGQISLERWRGIEMEKTTLYMIQIPFHEQEIVKCILSDRKDRIPSLWKQFTENNVIYMTAFEAGYITGVLSSQRNTIPECWRQLIDITDKIRKDAGVEVIDLGNNMVQLRDKFGNTIIRQKYDWEF